MKARVKATGTIIELSNIEPDYWEKLKHQYAGMAMQGIINNDELLTALCRRNIETTISDVVTSNAIIIATELVNRLKEEEK